MIGDYTSFLLEWQKGHSSQDCISHWVNLHWYCGCMVSLVWLVGDNGLMLQGLGRDFNAFVLIACNIVALPHKWHVACPGNLAARKPPLNWWMLTKEKQTRVTASVKVMVWLKAILLCLSGRLSSQLSHVRHMHFTQKPCSHALYHFAHALCMVQKNSLPCSGFHTCASSLKKHSKE